MGPVSVLIWRLHLDYFVDFSFLDCPRLAVKLLLIRVAHRLSYRTQILRFFDCLRLAIKLLLIRVAHRFSHWTQILPSRTETDWKSCLKVTLQLNHHALILE